MVLLVAFALAVTAAMIALPTAWAVPLGWIALAILGAWQLWSSPTGYRSRRPGVEWGGRRR